MMEFEENRERARLLLARAYPAPEAADLERAWENIGLLRRQRRQARGGRWRAITVRAAAAALLIAGGAVGGRLAFGPEAPVLRIDRSIIGTSRASLPSAVPAGRERWLRVRLWRENAGLDPFLLEDRSVRVPPGHDVRLSSGREASDAFAFPRFDVDLVIRTMRFGSSDRVVAVGAEMSAFMPEYDGRDDHGRFSGARVAGNGLLRGGESAHLYPFGPPREGGGPALKLELWLDSAMAEVARSAGLANGYEPMVIETAPRIQGAFLRWEASDSTGAWRIVKDRPHFQLTRGTVNILVGGPYPRGHLNVTMQPPPFGRRGPLCFRWVWGDGRPPQGGFCLSEQQPTVVTPIHGTNGRLLRVTLLEALDSLPP